MELPAPIVRLGDRIYRTSARVGIAVQGAVLHGLLWTLYVFGMGLTRLFAVVFGRRYLSLYDSVAAESYWADAEGYSVERERLEREY